jgi:FkbM family methyltransferase
MTVHRILQNVSDLRRFGLQFLWRHSRRFSKAHTTRITVDGQKIHVRAGQSDIDVIRQIYGSGHYNVTATIPALEERVRRKYEYIVRRGQTPLIVDCGANIGASSLWLKKRYPQASIIAIEPEQGNFAVLEQNAQECDGIIPIRAAVGSRAGFVLVDVGELGWTAQTKRAETGLPIVTIPEAFNRASGSPFMVKIDIEGFESDLFEENTDWLAEITVLHIEPHDWMFPGRGTSLAFQKAVARYDFELFIAGEVLTYVKL